MNWRSRVSWHAFVVDLPVIFMVLVAATAESSTYGLAMATV